MATRTISTRLAIQGESEYKQAIANINSTLKTLKSELALVESQYRGNANGMEALRAKGETLSKAQEAQKAKLEQTSAALQNAQKAQQAYSYQVEQSRAKLEGAKAKLEELKRSTSDTTVQQQKLTAEVEKHQKALHSAQAGLTAANKAVNDWQRSNNYAQRDLNELDAEIQRNNKYLDEARQSVDGCASSIDKFGQETQDAKEGADSMEDGIQALGAVLAAAGVAAGLNKITEALKACVDASIEFETAMAGVRRTVGGTDEELDAMARGFKDMALEIPATTTELGKIAETAGQLGIQKDRVSEFTEVMAMLATTTDLTAETAATMLAQFANITGLTDYERLGATVAQLGDATATTASKVVEMSQGMAAAADIAGMSETDILAIAASVGSLGIEAQAGSTAMSTLISTIFKAVETGSEQLSSFASVAGMSAKEFSGAWKEDAVGALDAFIKGLNNTERNGKSAVVILDELGITNVRQTKAILGLANAGDLLTNTISQANEAWEENTALQEKAGIMYGTTESQITMARNAFTELKIAIGDALTPALGELAEAGTSAFSWAAQFVEENPWLVQAITGAVGAMALLAGAVTAYSVVTAVAKKVQDSLNLSMSLCPAFAVAAAIGALIVVVGNLAAKASEAAEETAGMSEAVRESKKAFEETTGAAEDQKDSTLAMVSALESAMAAEEKTAASKAVILNLVNQLNEAVPSLALAYNEETDSLNLTTEAIERMALAQANEAEKAAAQQHLSELYVAREQAAIDLERAQERLRQSEETLAAATEKATATGYDEEYQMYAAQVQTDKLREEVEELVRQQEANEKQIAATETSYADLTAAEEDATEASEGRRKQIQDTKKTLEELAEASDALAGVTRTLAGAEEALTSALGEQKKSGKLGAETISDLIDKGYALALQIDDETGAVTLNEEAYLRLTQAKIDEQIASTMNDRKKILDGLSDETIASNNAAGARNALAAANYDLAISEYAVDKAIAGAVAGYDANVAALKKLKEGLGSYSYSSNQVARTSASTSKKIKTQAEKDLEAFKGVQAELKHALDMGEIANKDYYTALHDAQQQYLNDPANLEASRRIDEEIHKYNEGLETYQRLRSELEHELKVGAVNEEEYYRRLAKLRDDYLTDDSTQEVLEERGKVAEELYSLEQDRLKQYGDHLKEALADYQSQIDSLTEKYKDKLAEVQDAMDDIQKEQDAMKSKLSGYGDLFTIDDRGNLHLEDLEKQRKAVENYGKVLEDLKAKGINGELLNEILGMGIDDATVFGNKLLKMGDKEWDSYNQAYQDKQDEAIRIAKEFYQEQMDELETEYNGILDEALGVLEQTAFDSGTDTISELIKGMKEKEDEAAKEAARIVGAIEAEFRGMRLEVGPIGVNTPEVDGSHAGGLSYVPYDGYLAELHKGERVLTADEAKAFIAASMPRRYDVPQQGGGQMAQLQGMMQTVLQNQAARQESNAPIHIDAVLELDGEVVARKQLTYNRRAERLQGKSFVDRG